ncbi:MAG: exonuclease SbcCD subunit D [Arcanobacterium sp.]|nr:exonuclease SbcCD subunit D [Arcanobacterium sp.]
MKIFHTSDWHLGRTLHGADLTAAFEQWADFVVEIVRSEKIDAVLVSGDIFDRGVPPIAMVELLSSTLARLTEMTHVVLTAGNHDSAKRLGFGSALMRPELVIRTDSLESGSPIALPTATGELGAIVYALPYLDPDLERKRMATPAPGEISSGATPLLPRSHEAVIGTALARVRSDLLEGTGAALAQQQKTAPRIVMAHAFVVGGEHSASEQDIHIGGVDSVPVSLFDLRTPQADPLIDYVALGHLHGPQRVGSDPGPLMRYSGSPIAFSFSEEHQRKSGVLLSFSEASRTPEVELVEAPVFRSLHTLRGTLAELISGNFDAYQRDFVRAYVLDPSRPANLFAQLKARFPYLLEAHHERPAVQLSQAPERIARLDVQAMLREFFATNGGRQLNSAEEQLLRELWEQYQCEEKSAAC